MNQEMIDRVLSSERLPSLPAIALEVVDLVKSDNADLKQIAATIQNDPALASKILKTVNSSFYGQAYSISTISHALVVLGLKAVKTLALGFSLVNNLKDQGTGSTDDDGNPTFDHYAFWRRSLLTATAAKLMGEKLQLEETEEAFLGGLLQDLGMLAMHQTLGADYVDILREVGQDHVALREVEQTYLEATHADMGAKLAERWKLPKPLIHAIRYHETPEEATIECRKLARTVALGNAAAEVFMVSTWADDNRPGVALERYLHRAAEWFGWPTEEAEPLLRSIHSQTRQMQRLFELPTGDLGNVDQVLAKANEALMQMTLQAQMETNRLHQEAADLERANYELTEEVYTDALTRAANRRRFNDYLREQYVQAGPQRPLSVLFLDADHFKKFNDTYGHPTGDRVLVTLAKTLQQVFGEDGLVCRYGGEEFSVIVPDCPRVKAAQYAEKARRAIAAAEVQSDEGKALHITASIGAATYDGTFFKSPEQLVKAADNGVYAAKNAGRNTVRVFVPRPTAAAA